MVSPEVLRRYPFFAGLNHDNLVTIADSAEHRKYGAGDSFFHEGEDIKHFYLVEDGTVAIVMELPDRDVKHSVSEQFTGSMKTKGVTVSTVGPGEVFGWSGLVPPQRTSAGALAETDCRVVEFDAQKLLELFDENPDLGYLMTQKAARVIRRRLHDMRVESLAHYA